MEFRPNSLACEIAHGRSTSFIYGQLLEWNSRQLFLFSETLLEFVEIIKLVYVHFRPMNHVKYNSSCNVVGLRGLLEIYLC